MVVVLFEHVIGANFDLKKIFLDQTADNIFLNTWTYFQPNPPKANEQEIFKNWCANFLFHAELSHEIIRKLLKNFQRF